MPATTSTYKVYQHVLAAIDILDSDLQVLIIAKQLASTHGSRLSVLHVCPSPVTGYGETTASHHIVNNLQVKQQIYPAFKSLLDKVAIKEGQSHLLSGRPADVIHQFALDQSCDLVVVGSHGYSGIKALLGSTVHKVLHGAHCDILTVRIRE